MATAVLLEGVQLPPVQPGVAMEGMLQPLGAGPPGLSQAAKHGFESLQALPADPRTTRPHQAPQALLLDRRIVPALASPTGQYTPGCTTCTPGCTGCRKRRLHHDSHAPILASTSVL